MHPTEIQGLRATSMVPGAGIGVLLQLTLAFATGPIYPCGSNWHYTVVLRPWSDGDRMDSTEG